MSIDATSADPLLRTGKVSFGGMLREVSLAYVPETKVGDYVIVHVGFAISQLDEQEAERIFEDLQQITAHSQRDLYHRKP
jgi:hydrogenase expression/formation protein HypC